MPPSFLLTPNEQISKDTPRSYRNQLIPETASDLLPKIIADANSFNYNTDPSYDEVRVIKVFETTDPPKAGSSLALSTEFEENRPPTISHCMAISVGKTHRNMPLPEEVGNNIKDLKSITLTKMSMYCFDASGVLKQPLKVGDKLPVHKISALEARITGIPTGNNVVQAEADGVSAKGAAAGATGQNVGDNIISNPPKVNYNPANLCKDASLILELAKKTGIPPAVMAAFRAVESGGNTSAIRFEPNKFNKEKEITTKVPYTNSGKGFSTVLSETNKSAFERAYAINKAVAIRSTSWGSYQVMGWALLAIPEIANNPDKAVSLFYADSNRISQEMVVSWFKENKNAVQYANKLDFSNLASVYNGTLYKNNQYDSKLKQAYEKALADCKEYKV